MPGGLPYVEVQGCLSYDLWVEIIFNAEKQWVKSYHAHSYMYIIQISSRDHFENFWQASCETQSLSRNIM